MDTPQTDATLAKLVNDLEPIKSVRLPSLMFRTLSLLLILSVLLIGATEFADTAQGRVWLVMASLLAGIGLIAAAGVVSLPQYDQYAGKLAWVGAAVLVAISGINHSLQPSAVWLWVAPTPIIIEAALMRFAIAPVIFAVAFAGFRALPMQRPLFTGATLLFGSLIMTMSAVQLIHAPLGLVDGLVLDLILPLVALAALKRPFDELLRKNLRQHHSRKSKLFRA